MTGYLHQSRFYDEIFKQMVNHYQRAIRFTNFDNESRRALAEHLTLAYLRELENLDGSGVFPQFLGICNLEQKLESLSFIKHLSMDMSRDDSIGKVSDHRFAARVIALWQYLDSIHSASRRSNEDARSICAALAGLTRFLPELNQLYCELLFRSVDCFQSDVQHPFFLEHLVYLKNHSTGQDNAERIGQVLLVMLKVCTPTFQSEHVIELVDYVYSNSGSKNLGNQICDWMGRRGVDFLEPTYRKYNSK